MAKKNAMLEKIYRDADVRYRALFDARMDMLMQICVDAACIAANETLQLGPKRAKAFLNEMQKSVNEIARMMTDDQKDDETFEYAKAKLDDRLKKITGDTFQPWEERYGRKC